MSRRTENLTENAGYFLFWKSPLQEPKVSEVQTLSCYLNGRLKKIPNQKLGVPRPFIAGTKRSFGATAVTIAISPLSLHADRGSPKLRFDETSELSLNEQMSS